MQRQANCPESVHLCAFTGIPGNLKVMPALGIKLHPEIAPA